MMWLILAELLVVCVATLAFVGMYAVRSDWWSPTGRMVMSWAVEIGRASCRVRV